MSRRLLRRTTAGACLLLLAAPGCGEMPPPPPAVVIRASPEALCLGDDFRTEIALDGLGSTPHLTLIPVPPPQDAPPPEYQWALSGARHRVVGGDLDGPEVSVTSAGDRPLHVTLRVRVPGGGEGTAERSIPVVLPDEASGVCLPGQGEP